MALIIKKKVRWNPSTATDVTKYKVYWSLAGDGNPDYNSDFAETVNTELTIPDEAPTFPVAVEGDYILGITAVDDVGNESDMALSASVPFDFNAPDAPSGVTVENV